MNENDEKKARAAADEAVHGIGGIAQALDCAVPATGTASAAQKGSGGMPLSATGQIDTLPSSQVQAITATPSLAFSPVSTPTAAVEAVHTIAAMAAVETETTHTAGPKADSVHIPSAAAPDDAFAAANEAVHTIAATAQTTFASVAGAHAITQTETQQAMHTAPSAQSTAAGADTVHLLQAAHATKPVAAALSSRLKDTLLHAMADSLGAHMDAILAANAADLAAARGTLPDSMLDRLALSAVRVHSMAAGLRAVAALPDPVGTVDETRTLENGLIMTKTRVPMGVIAIIYESRPNVTADAAALCLKSGNVCVLRGGREAIGSNRAIVAALHAALRAHGQPETLINFVTDTSRASATELMTARGWVDLLIPRGGAGLIRACVENATVPCIETGTGICHIYVDEAADQSAALRIVENAKVSRPSVCNAAEVCLVHAAIADAFLPRLATTLFSRGVELRCEPRAYSILAAAMPEHLARANDEPANDDDAWTQPAIPANVAVPAPCILCAGAEDFDTEFLSLRLAVAVVDSTHAAIAHIARHSTGHSEAIVTQNTATAVAFTQAVDSAAVYVNASTRFTDGGEFGLGCEMGISTQKLGARGPMGLREMTSYKYIIQGSGQIR